MKIAKNYLNMILVVNSILFLVVIISYPQVSVAKNAKAQEFPVLELKSKLMSFSDQLMAEIDQATYQYLYQGQPKSPQKRMAVSNGRLNACASAVSIAAGKNPEVALLDMIAMVKLYSFTVEDNWMPKVLGPEAKIFLEVFHSLELQLSEIADGILSKEQTAELNKLLANWRKNNRNKLAFVSKIRFSEFSELRHSSLLFEKGKPRGLLSKVGEATQEIERTRLLAERAMFLAERQPKLIAWQVEQVFYNLAVTDEATGFFDSFEKLPDSANNVAENARKIAVDIDEIQNAMDLNSEANVEKIVDRLSDLSSRIITHTIRKTGLSIILLGLLMLIGLLAVLLCYKYLSLMME